mmetsp:Transcript_10696/g.16209  ORF Transcript_10696/g.16209 Transcript_10696/m.16209 type:complete len:1036 (-) Transcript_10696:74-3181(-)
MEGYLYKRGRGKNISFIKPWAYRLFVLDADTKQLSYFTVNKGKRSFRGQVSVENASMKECTDSGKPFSFELCCFGTNGVEEVMTLASPSKHEMVEWVLAISSCAPCEAKWVTDMNKREAATQPNPSSKISKAESTTRVLEDRMHKMATDSGSGPSPWVPRLLSLDLDSRQLSVYFEGGGSNVLRQSVAVTSGTVEEMPEELAGRLHVFRVIPSSGDSLVLAAKDEAQMSLWIKNLRECMDCELEQEKKDSSAADIPDIRTFPSPSSPSTSPSKTMFSPSESFSMHDIDDEDGDCNRMADVPDSSPISPSPPVVLVPQPEKEADETTNADCDAADTVHDTDPKSSEKIDSKQGNHLNSSQASPVLHTVSRENSGSFEDTDQLPSQDSYRAETEGKSDGPCSSSRNPVNVESISRSQSYLNMQIIVLNVSHPANRLVMRTRMKELFRDDPCGKVEFKHVKERLKDLMHDAHQSASAFPHLPREGCQWEDLLRFFRFNERNMRPRGCSIEVSLGVILPDIGKRVEFSCEFATWARAVASEVRALHLPTIDSLDDEEVLMLVNAHVDDVSEQVMGCLMDDLILAEDYMLYEEEVVESRSDAMGAGGVQNKSKSHSNADDEFSGADRDGDGVVSRAEWRRWMAEREELIIRSNKEKADLIKETTNLRRALNPITAQTYAELRRSADMLEAVRSELDDANDEIKRLKMELEICKDQLRGSDISKESLRARTAFRNDGINSPDTSPCVSISKIRDLDTKELDYSDSSDSSSLGTGGNREADLTGKNVCFADEMPSTASMYESDHIDRNIQADMKIFEEELANQPKADGVDLDALEKSLLAPAEETSWVQRYMKQPSVERSLSNSHSFMELSSRSPTEGLPRSINESYADNSPSDLLHHKKPVQRFRPTLIDARRKDLYTSSPRDSESDYGSPGSNSGGAKHTPSPDSKLKAREHPLHAALRSKSPNLAFKKPSYASPPLSGPVTSKDTRSPSPPFRHKSSRSALHIPPSQRYRLAPTEAFLAKKKKAISAPIGAVRVSGDWK